MSNVHVTLMERFSFELLSFRREGSAVSSPRISPLALPAKGNPVCTLQQLPFSICTVPFWRCVAIDYFWWPGRMQFRFGSVRASARYAEVKMCCVPIGGVSWNGPSYSPC